MRVQYDTWAEVANDFCEGDSVSHLFDGHDPDECLGWQRGVRSFCKWLDARNVPVVPHDDMWPNPFDAAIEMKRNARV